MMRRANLRDANSPSLSGSFGRTRDCRHYQHELLLVGYSPPKTGCQNGR